MSREIIIEEITLALDLLCDWQIFLNKREKQGFVYNLWDWYKECGFNSYRIERALIDFLNDGLIYDVSVDVFHSDDDKLIEKLDYSDGGDFAKAGLFPEKYSSSSYLFTLFLKVNESKLNDYIDNYVDDWIQENLFFSDRNIYKATGQLHVVIERIQTLLLDYPSSNLLIESVRNDNVDFIGTMLFLRKMGFVDILHLVSGYESVLDKKGVSIRVNVLDSFFDAFKTNYAYTDEHYYYVIHPEQLKDEKIAYLDGNKLVCKDKQKRLNKGTLPYLLMMKASESEDRLVKFSDLKTEKGQKQAVVIKNVNNFIASIRRTFDYDDGIRIAEISEDSVALDPDVFYFQPQKDKLINQLREISK